LSLWGQRGHLKQRFETNQENTLFRLLRLFESRKEEEKAGFKTLICTVEIYGFGPNLAFHQNSASF
jgi:hypothetical protein